MDAVGDENAHQKFSFEIDPGELTKEIKSYLNYGNDLKYYKDGLEVDPHTVISTQEGLMDLLSSNLSQVNNVARSEVAATFLACFERPRYLEISVSKGETFFSISAENKVAIDPYFQFDYRAAKYQSEETHFYQVTSDDYFSNIMGGVDLVDVIFLDGLHTFDQTLRNFNSAVEALVPGVVIVIDDVVPNSYGASLRDMNLSLEFKASRGIQ